MERRLAGVSSTDGAIVFAVTPVPQHSSAITSASVSRIWLTSASLNRFNRPGTHITTRRTSVAIAPEPALCTLIETVTGPDQWSIQTIRAPSIPAIDYQRRSRPAQIVI
jgi:hypothetical protein